MTNERAVTRIVTLLVGLAASLIRRRPAHFTPAEADVAASRASEALVYMKTVATIFEDAAARRKK